MRYVYVFFISWYSSLLMRSNLFVSSSLKDQLCFFYLWNRLDGSFTFIFINNDAFPWSNRCIQLPFEVTRPHTIIKLSFPFVHWFCSGIKAMMRFLWEQPGQLKQIEWPSVKSTVRTVTCQCCFIVLQDMFLKLHFKRFWKFFFLVPLQFAAAYHCVIQNICIFSKTPFFQVYGILC